MQWAEAITAISGLSAAEHVRFLTRLSWELTIVARYYYRPGTDDFTDHAAVRAVNELQHILAGQTRAILDDDPARYPDDLLVQIVLGETPDRPDLRGLVRGAFGRAYDFVRSGAATAARPQPTPAG